MKNPTLKHLVKETGEIATRTTARTYTHVVISRCTSYYSHLVACHEYSVKVNAAWHAKNGTTQAAFDEADARRRSDEAAKWSVLSWAGSAALAMKAAAAFQSRCNGNRGAHTSLGAEVRVEAINGGTLPA